MRKPSPISKTINITLEEAYQGLNKPIEIERWIHKWSKKVEKKIYVPIPAGIDNQDNYIAK